MFAPGAFTPTMTGLCDTCKSLETFRCCMSVCTSHPWQLLSYNASVWVTCGIGANKPEPENRDDLRMNYLQSGEMNDGSINGWLRHVHRVTNCKLCRLLQYLSGVTRQDARDSPNRNSCLSDSLRNSTKRSRIHANKEAKTGQVTRRSR